MNFEFEALLDWYRIFGRKDLPWRNYNFPLDILGYRVWLAEILLQQTQASRVSSYYLRILQKYPTLLDLSGATYDEFFPYYSGLGYYSRARNLLQCAQIVVQDFNGIFPNDERSLRKLPGIGPYTAQAIRSFVYNEPIFAIDTNLKKVFSRYFFGKKGEILPQELITRWEKDFSQEGYSSRDINNALMDFSSWQDSHLSAQGYPFLSCKWKNTFGKEESREIIPRKVFPKKDAQIILVLHKNHSQYFSDPNSQIPEVFSDIPGKLIPFYLGNFESGKFREEIQKYFLLRYSLYVSVRPPKMYGFYKNSPFILIYAQVQKGEYTFSIASKQDHILFRKPFDAISL